MKRILLIMMLGAVIFLGFSPVVSAENKALKQVDGPEGPACDEDEKRDSPAKKRSHFKGHWGGFEIGLNNYFTENYDFSIPAEIDYMSLHSGKSRNINLNFGQLSIGLARHVGFVTGLGIGWNNYMFSGDNNIIKNDAGDIVELEREIYYPDQTLKKSKFSTFYLKLPVLFEVQIPTDHQRLNISAGPVGALKLGSYSVMRFDNDDKIKSDDDFNLNLFRYGVTARIGYENFNIYGTYYFTPLFKTNMGPGGVDLYPFEIGIAFSID
ncbi:MAG: PorT family protein [Bacteroidales bacterium]|nr:PorT family protein [Bacteroidales bacterium]